MIQLTRINGEKILVNPDLIIWVESKPDSMITFSDSKTLMVRESAAEIAEIFFQYQQKIHSRSAITCSTQQPSLEL